MAATTTKKPAMRGLMTGYPGFVAKPLLRRLLDEHPRGKFTVLVEDGRKKDAEDDLAALGAADKKRVRVAVGDVRKMDLGLAGLEIEALRDTTHFFHLAGIQSAQADRALLNAVNVDGVRNTLALARELPKLERFVHFSSCFVAGDRPGVVLEEELETPAANRTPYEESKLRGEKLARAAMSDLPITIVRPSVVVGDSVSGAVDRFDGVYAMGILIVTSPLSVPLPLPGPGLAPLHLVPVDYLTRVVCRLTDDERAVGKTFHVVDPNPLSARQVYELVAARAGKKTASLPKALRSAFTSSLALSVASQRGSAVLSAFATQATSLIDAIAGPLSSKGGPRMENVKKSAAAVELFDRFVIFNAANTATLLAGTDVVCPRFDTYVDALVKYVKDSLREERKTRTSKKQVVDPLA